MNFPQAIDPRRHLAAAVGWAMVAIISLASLVSANVASAAAEARALRDTRQLTTQFALQIRHSLAMSIRMHLSVVQATAAQIVSTRERSDDVVRGNLEAVRAQFPEFLWLGVTDDAMRVMAGTDGALEGRAASGLPWARDAGGRIFLGPLRTAPELQRDPAPRIVELSAPVRNASGRWVGVVGAYLEWRWIEGLLRDIVATLDTHGRAELFIAARDGTVIIGPPAWLGRKPSDADLAEGGRYLVGDPGADDTLPWHVSLRQPAASATAAAQATGRTVFWVVMLSGLLAALAAVLVIQRLLSRLGRLSSQAQEIRGGRRAELERPRGRDEVGQIGRTMVELVHHLQHERDALAGLNAELDSRVAERSARIEKLAAENRHAAVTRERLRLARDLHDTLAHSLMALLTQIRLIRKLRPRLSQDELEQELARSESVAADGLAKARAAITQMRFNGIQDVGLGAAVRELARRFAERTGLQAEVQGSGDADALADERAETVFRIVEEAFHNVERHAQARRVQVELRTDAGSGDHHIRVSDDGQGFDTEVSMPGHYGLLGMREQAALIGARLIVQSRPGAGTEVELVVPP
ncbi:MAG: HAMP domain-containing protein [Burkholderiales bacterium]|nr:HAMP domain-containing protein [Burkholderiales bacterium]